MAMCNLVDAVQFMVELCFSQQCPLFCPLVEHLHLLLVWENHPEELSIKRETLPVDTEDSCMDGFKACVLVCVPPLKINAYSCKKEYILHANPHSA